MNSACSRVGACNIFGDGDLSGVPDRDGGALEFLLDSEYSEKGGFPMEKLVMTDGTDHRVS